MTGAPSSVQQARKRPPNRTGGAQAVGESLLARLDKEASRCREAALRLAMNFRANDVSRVKACEGFERESGCLRLQV
jgi:hypothetical protein